MVRHTVAVREPTAGESALAKGKRRRVGVILLLLGAILISLAAGDALVATVLGGG
jgi:hypothetical protein